MMDGHLYSTRCNISIVKEQPYWFGRKQDSNGARITTHLNEDNILGYPKILFNLHLCIHMILLFRCLKIKNGQIKILVSKWIATIIQRKSQRLIDNLTSAKFVNAHLLINWVRY